MKVKDVFKLGLIKADTEIGIQEFHWKNGGCTGFSILARGYMDQECIQKYMERDVEGFTWWAVNQFHIDIKEKGDTRYACISCFLPRHIPACAR